MAGNAGNNMHNDASMSDAYEASGPLGLALQVRSRTQGFGGYGTLAYDRRSRLVGVTSNGRRFQLELMDPYTLEELASYDLPPRPPGFLLQGNAVGGGESSHGGPTDWRDRRLTPCLSCSRTTRSSTYGRASV